jgi:hypothetical protein
MRTIHYFVVCLILCCASILGSSQAAAQCPTCPSCPSGVCPAPGRSQAVIGSHRGSVGLQAGQPARNVGRAALGAARTTGRVAAKVAIAPVRFFRNHKPVRKALRGVGRILTGRGPLMSRIRSRGC